MKLETRPEHPMDTPLQGSHWVSSNNWVHGSRFEKIVKVLIDRCSGEESKYEGEMYAPCDPAIDQQAQVSKQGSVGLRILSTSQGPQSSDLEIGRVMKPFHMMR